MSTNSNIVFFLSIAYNTNMDKKEIIGKNIRMLRTERGKSQSDLGKVLDISHVAISDIERGKTKLSVEILLKIADFFGVSPEEIISDTQVQKATPSFSQGRGSYGMTDEDKKSLKKAQDEFRKFARKKAEGEI